MGNHVAVVTHFNGTVIAILLSVAIATTTNMLTRIRNPIDPPYSLPRHGGSVKFVRFYHNMGDCGKGKV